MIIWKKSWFPYAVYCVLALLVLWSLLRPGYVLTLDMCFSPNVHYSDYVWGISEWATSVYAGGTAITPLVAFIQSLSHILPVWVIEKFILFLILFLCGLGAHKLAAGKYPGCYFAGFLYMLNPFVYSRFIAGQWGVLWAYALMPIAICAFFKLLHKGSWANAAVTAIIATLVGIIQIQGYFLLLFTFIVIFIVKTIQERNIKGKAFNDMKWMAITAGFGILLNLYWLIPLLTSSTTFLTQLNQADQLFFSPKNVSGFNLLFSIASMHGFWRGGNIYAVDIIPFFWIFFVFLLYLSFFGLIDNILSYFKQPKLNGQNSLFTDITLTNEPAYRTNWQAVSFAIIGVISFILAIGMALPFTKPFFEWLWENVFIFKTFRDSQKYVGLICLTYAFLGGLGLNALMSGFKHSISRLYKAVLVLLVILALLTPLAYSYTMFNFNGRLGVTDYPVEWSAVNDYLNRDGDNFSVLFLPWHMYMDFSWLPNKDKRLINPSQQFFQKPIIMGDNYEITGLYSQSTNSISKYIEFLLANQNKITNLGELLAPLNVKYVILVNEADFDLYNFLYQQTDLRVEQQFTGITLFKNEYTTSKIYAVDNIEYIDGLDEYLELSKTQDVMNHIYVLGDGQNNETNIQVKNLDFTENSPASYQVKGTSNKYTVFTVPQNVTANYWEYDGQEPVFQNLGFMPVFSSSIKGANITYTRFYRVYLPCYIVSGLTLCSIIIYCFWYSRRKRSRENHPHESVKT
jgi:hypothetical protein